MTSEKFNVKDTFIIKENVEQLSDWFVDYKNGFFYFLMNVGTIIIYDYKRKI